MIGKNTGNPKARERDEPSQDAGPEPAEDRQPAVSVEPYRPWEAEDHEPEWRTL